MGIGTDSIGDGSVRHVCKNGVGVDKGKVGNVGQRCNDGR